MPKWSANTPSTAAPSPSPVATTSPLSGRKGGVGTPIVVVKYDNTPAAQPHRGLTSADLVYVEPVEWGLTRIAAVFSTRVPAVVGPVRSARISDIDLMAQFGRVERSQGAYGDAAVAQRGDDGLRVFRAVIHQGQS